MSLAHNLVVPPILIVVVFRCHRPYTLSIKARSNLLIGLRDRAKILTAFDRLPIDRQKWRDTERNGPWAAIMFVLTLRCPTSGTTSTPLHSTTPTSCSTGLICLAATCASPILAAATLPPS